MGKWILSFFLLLVWTDVVAQQDSKKKTIVNVSIDTVGQSKAIDTNRVANLSSGIGRWDLFKNWRYLNDDDTAYAAKEYNDSNWQRIDSRLFLAFDSIRFEGVGWFRRHIYVDSALLYQPLALNLKQEGASEVYLDGKLLAKYGKIDGENSVYYSPRLLPKTIIFKEPGTHVFAVRYANYHPDWLSEKKTYNSAGFQIWLMGTDEDSAGTRVAGKFIVFLCLLIGLFFALSTSHMLLYLYYRAERSNLYFSFFCLAMSLSYFFMMVKGLHTNPRVSHFADTSMMFFLSLMCIGLSGLSNELFAKKKLRFYIIVVLSFVPFVVYFFSESDAIGLFLIMLIIVMVESFVLTLRAILRKEKGAYIIGIGIFFFTLFFLASLSLSLLVGNFDLRLGTVQGQIMVVLSIMAILSIPFSMSIYLARKFASVNKSLNIQLQQVQELSEANLKQEQEKKRMLETEKERLEQEVSVRTKEIVEEKKKSDDLLRNILPEEVAEELKQRGSTEAKYFDHVSVLFTDFVDFTQAGEKFSPQELVDELDTCFKAFDAIISKYGIEKIKTIGDAYLAVCGLPKATDDHAEKMVNAAMDIMTFMQNRKKALPDRAFDIRIGIHSGAVVAGIVGVKKFAYDIWGDTVNIAARMEQTSEPGRINISENTHELVKGKFEFVYRGEIEAKNKGKMKMYFLEA
ncbi:MAG: hypothetical protein KDC11_05235 [Chitinophagaceae bacterium]|nr:hypothetical protein [Chitinophagaceae bacterium]